MKPILCLDFDGVIHSYTSGWLGYNIIPDNPVRGAKEFIEKSSEFFEIYVFSTRCNRTEGIEAIKKWLLKWGFPKLNVVFEKPPAFLTIDDRAIQFNGEWPEIEVLKNFRTWIEK